MYKEKIDILMATYNGEKYLKEQIDSILNQTYSNFDLYISDDFSNDSTTQILKEYSEKDDRIKLILNDQNYGSNENFKKLLKHVKSKYFMFADQDDVWLNDKIEKTFNKLVIDKSDLVFTDLKVVDSELNTIHESFNMLKKYKNKILKCLNKPNLVYLYNVVTGCTIMCKSKFIEQFLQIKSNDKNILHDHILPLIVSQNGKVSYLNEITILYRQHGNNQVGTKRYVDRFEKFDDVREHLIDVKIRLFEMYVNNNAIFKDDINNLNKNALDYFYNISKKKNLNFKNWKIFYILYKNETISYFVLYFIIMNFPCIAKLGYKLKNLFKNKGCAKK